MKNKEARLLNKLKVNCVTLKNRYQIPSKLYDCIMELYLNQTESYIKGLMNITNEYMRVKGFYKDKHKDNKANNEVLKELKKLK